MEFCNKYANKTSYNSKGQNTLNDKKKKHTPQGKDKREEELIQMTLSAVKTEHIIQSSANDTVNGHGSPFKQGEVYGYNTTNIM